MLLVNDFFSNFYHVFQICICVFDLLIKKHKILPVTIYHAFFVVLCDINIMKYISVSIISHSNIRFLRKSMLVFLWPCCVWTNANNSLIVIFSQPTRELFFLSFFQENITSNYIQTLEKLLPTVKGDFLIFEPNASELLGAFSELNEANKSHISNIQQLLIRWNLQLTNHCPNYYLEEACK